MWAKEKSTGEADVSEREHFPRGPRHAKELLGRLNAARKRVKGFAERWTGKGLALSRVSIRTGIGTTGASLQVPVLVLYSLQIGRDGGVPKVLLSGGRRADAGPDLIEESALAVPTFVTQESTSPMTQVVLTLGIIYPTREA